MPTVALGLAGTVKTKHVRGKEPHPHLALLWQIFADLIFTGFTRDVLGDS